MSTLQDWKPSDGLKLEPNALSAVLEQENNVIVTAGPGAGKTELLAQRADFLLRTGSSPYPRRILAISFKVDAARNLQDRVRQRAGAQYAARFDSFTFHAFAKRIIDNYRLALTGDDALESDYTIHNKEYIQGSQITFEDLVPLALKILRTNRYARNALRQTYSHVFMDEFQDATKPQYDFLCKAFLGSDALLTGVGDTKQSIMGFAGALDGVIAKFESDFQASHHQLYQNFRSKPRLRRMQNRMIRDLEPQAALHDTELPGNDGTIRKLSFESDRDEAVEVSNTISDWLEQGIPPREITVIIRQQPHLVAETLGRELTSRGVSYRNEQKIQDLTSEPVANLIFNFLSVVANDGQPEAYSDLIRVSAQGESEEANQIFESKLNKLLQDNRNTIRDISFDVADTGAWEKLVVNFLNFVTRAKVAALSPTYQQGDRLDEVVKQALNAFRVELSLDGSPTAALERLSETHALRILTVHKCKGLEFEKVVILGVEHELFWGKIPRRVKSEFFVAASRAKDELVLTSVSRRMKPQGASRYWKVARLAHSELLSYADPTSMKSE